MIRVLRRFPGMTIAVSALLLGVLYAPAVAARGRLITLNSKNYNSPSGEYSLNVDPSDRYGRHGAAYRVTRNGEEVWSERLPFTLWDAGITNGGVVGGYAYTRGREGLSERSEDRSPGDFLVIIIDPEGKIRLKKTAKRQPSRFLHSDPNPIALGLIVDAVHDRLVVRVADPDVNRGVETWWIHRLSSGTEVAKLQPKKLMANHQPAQFVIDAKPVAGTPLTLLHWWRYDDRKERTVGARFTLVDLNAKPVWSLDLMKDYEIPGDEVSEDKLRDLIEKQGAILRVDRSGHFELYFAAESKRVTFSVKQGPYRNWRVSEVARAAYFIASPEPKALSIPERPLKFLGPLVLQSKAGQPGRVIRNVWDFVLDGRGRIAFLRNEKNGPDSFVLVDRSGKLLHKIRLTIDDEGDAGQTAFTWVGGNRFVITRSDDGVEGKAKAWWLDVRTGKLKPIPGFDCPPVESIDGSDDGSFVALAKMRYKYTMTDTLRGFDSSGKQTWNVDDGQPDDAELLFSPEDIAVTNTGEVAVLDNIKNTIKMFDRRGRFLRVIDLEEAWGRKPNYLCGIAAGANGDFLVHDFEGSPPFVRMKRDGTARGGFQPKYADGSTFDTRGGVQVAPDGRLWTSDGHALLRFSDSGIVDLVLGRAPQADELGKIAALTIDGRGLIYAVDSRTGSVHVFESDGALLHVCRTEPTDSSGELFDPPITVTDQSHVYLGLGEIPGSSEGRYLHFSADGTRLGTKQLKTQRCYVQPGTGNVLALAYDEAYLVNAGGQTIRRIARRPDGNWLEGIDRASVAADGSFAIVSAAGDNSDSPSPTVSLYDSIGAPIRTVSMPPSVGRFPRIVYDGRHLVATGKDRVVIFDSTGSPAQTFTPVIKGEKAPEDKAYWYPFLIANGRELLLFDSENTRLWRYTME